MLIFRSAHGTMGMPSACRGGALRELPGGEMHPTGTAVLLGEAEPEFMQSRFGF